jgi:hypothetical protein
LPIVLIGSPLFCRNTGAGLASRERRRVRSGRYTRDCPRTAEGYDFTLALNTKI